MNKINETIGNKITDIRIYNLDLSGTVILEDKINTFIALNTDQTIIKHIIPINKKSSNL